VTDDPALVSVVGLVGRVAQALQAGDDDAARARAAADLAQLDAWLGTQPATGFDLAQIGGALRLLGDWLRAPTAAHEAAAQGAILELQATLGPRIGWDPTREDAARRAQYRREARAALDALFDKPKP
jgi:hypothetical protein